MFKYFKKRLNSSSFQRQSWEAWSVRAAWHAGPQRQRGLLVGETQPGRADPHVSSGHGQAVERLQFAVHGGPRKGPQPGSG